MNTRTDRTRILLVTHDAGRGAALSDVLTRQGMSCSVVETGLAAAQVLWKHPPDAVLISSWLPDIDPFAILRLFTDPGLPQVIPAFILLLPHTAPAMDRHPLRTGVVQHEGFRYGNDGWQQYRIAIERGACDAFLQDCDDQTIALRLAAMLALLTRVRNEEGMSDGTASMKKGTCLPPPGAATARVNTMKTAWTFLNQLDEVLAVLHSDQNCSSEPIAAAMGISSEMLGKRVKAFTGGSSRQYLLTYRLQKARAIIETEPVRISEAARRCGFRHYSHFARVYRREFGHLPKDTHMKAHRRQRPGGANRPSKDSTEKEALG